MKIAIAQLNYHIGNFEQNVQKMLQAVEEAKQQGANIILFGELAVCGYPPRDFLEFSDFIRSSREAVYRLCAASQDIAIAVGAPTVNPDLNGKDLYNSAYFLYNGQVLHVAHKALLPTYDIFDEYRYFEPAREFHVVNFGGKRIAITICEDIWNLGNANPLYTMCPMDEMMSQSPDFMLNLSASPFHYNQAHERIHTLRENARRYRIPIFYSNGVGAQTELIFDGGSVAMTAFGDVYDEMPYFSEEVRTYQLEDLYRPQPERTQRKEKYELIYKALICGIQDYFKKLGFKKAILGLSGGVDSAITLVLAAHALGAENVLPVLMPSRYSSEHSVNDSLELVKNLGCPHKIIPIEEPFAAFLKTLQPHFEDKAADVTEENIQARVRAIILMALSNKHGSILLNTTNKSEAAVGYGTLYGDLAGGLAVLGDVYKSEIYQLAAYINEHFNQVLPQHILQKAPSAELRPNQKDSDSLPDYAVLDRILYQYIEKRQGISELIEMGFSENLVKRVMKLVNTNEYKRHQVAPILRVSAKAFGVGRRFPIAAKYFS